MGEQVSTDLGTGKRTVVQLPKVDPVVATVDEDGSIIGGAHGELLSVSPRGTVETLAHVGRWIEAVAADKLTVWFVDSHGSVGWVNRSGSSPVHEVGALKGAHSFGVVVVKETLWVLTDKGSIQRFAQDGPRTALKGFKRGMSLTKCTNGTWITQENPDGRTATISLLDADGRALTTWRPGYGVAYTACADDQLWAVDVTGRLAKSPAAP
ncbi:MAG: hypothetical protein ABIR57_11020 [Aeromicrobium sp.]